MAITHASATALPTSPWYPDPQMLAERSTIALVAACSSPAMPPGDGGGSGTPAMLSAAPTGDVALGTVIVGHTSPPSAITLSNDGDQSSGPIAISFDDASLGFAVVTGDTCSGQ